MATGDYPFTIDVRGRRIFTAPAETPLPSFTIKNLTLEEVAKLPEQRIASIVGLPFSIRPEPKNSTKNVKEELEKLRKRVRELEARERCVGIKISDDSIDNSKKRAISFEDEIL